jgi:hypothetical protein
MDNVLNSFYSLYGSQPLFHLAFALCLITGPAAAAAAVAALLNACRGAAWSLLRNKRH